MSFAACPRSLGFSTYSRSLGSPPCLGSFGFSARFGRPPRLHLRFLHPQRLLRQI